MNWARLAVAGAHIGQLGARIAIVLRADVDGPRPRLEAAAAVGIALVKCAPAAHCAMHGAKMRVASARLVEVVAGVTVEGRDHIDGA